MGFGPGDVIYLIEEPLNSLGLVATASDIWVPISIFITTVIWSAALLYSRPVETFDLRRRAVVVLVPFLMLASVHVSRAFAPLGADVRAVVSLFTGTYHYSRGLRNYARGVAKRDVPAAKSVTAPPNILLVVGESIRRDRFAAVGQGLRNTTPYLSTFVSENAEHVTVFNKHTPNSASTFFALSGILLGRLQATDREAFNTTPVIWQFAKSAGLKTFVVTSQSWSWGGLQDSLVEAQRPDWYADIDGFGFEQVNDIGADDLLVADRVADWIAQNGSDPFLGVVQLNSTHFPFHASDSVPWDVTDESGRYDAAIVRTDQAVGKIIEALKAKQILGSTIIIFVSDHAEGLLENYDETEEEYVRSTEPEYVTGSRSQSCDPLFINAPMFMYVPQDFARPPKLNENRVTSHIDILPTIISYFGYDVAFDGAQSLLAEIPEDRVAFCFTGSATALYSQAGFGVRRGDDFIFHRADFERLHSWNLSEGDVSVRNLRGDIAGAEELKQTAVDAWPQYVNFVLSR